MRLGRQRWNRSIWEDPLLRTDHLLPATGPRKALHMAGTRVSVTCKSGTELGKVITAQPHLTTAAVGSWRTGEQMVVTDMTVTFEWPVTLTSGEYTTVSNAITAASATAVPVRDAIAPAVLNCKVCGRAAWHGNASGVFCPRHGQ